ncbi:MAG: hypothetical protein IPO27_07210 [Bacteroidetes bacterium]|nr:hypothetical protein [Bacteroidota bacterium]
MKQLIYLLISTLIFGALVSCNGAKRALRNGDYERSVYLSWKKLRKHPQKEKYILLLEEGFKKAQENDMQEISLLKQENRSDNWDRIYVMYNEIRRRQNKVKSLPELRVKSQGNRIVKFPTIDVDAQMLEAKQGAASDYYSRAERLLSKGDKQSARNAFYEIEKIKKYYKEYKSSDSLQQIARNRGINYAIINVNNQSGMPLPAGYEDELRKINLRDIERTWLLFETRESPNRAYDYIVKVNVKQINIAPERLAYNNYTETKQIQDGWQYVLDNKGNVKKDSLGNDMKEPKYKTISCVIHETIMQKAAMVNGVVEFIDLQTKQLVRSVPIAGENRFEHGYAIANGDLNALSQVSLDKLRIQPVPFPPTSGMISATLPIVKNMAIQAIQNNSGLLD